MHALLAVKLIALIYFLHFRISEFATVCGDISTEKIHESIPSILGNTEASTLALEHDVTVPLNSVCQVDSFSGAKLADLVNFPAESTECTSASPVTSAVCSTVSDKVTLEMESCLHSDEAEPTVYCVQDLAPPDKEACTLDEKTVETSVGISDSFPSSETVQDFQKACYKFDLYDTDSINPFKTGGSKLQNSPPPVNISVVPVEELSDDKPVKMEFVMDGMEKNPSPKKFGKRPVPIKKQEVQKYEFPVKMDEQSNNEEAIIPPRKSSYSFDWDNLEDPNFNPFGGGAKVNSSPVAVSRGIAEHDTNSDTAIAKCKLVMHIAKETEVADKCSVVQSDVKDDHIEKNPDILKENADISTVCTTVQSDYKEASTIALETDVAPVGVVCKGDNFPQVNSSETGSNNFVKSSVEDTECTSVMESCFHSEGEPVLCSVENFAPPSSSYSKFDNIEASSFDKRSAENSVGLADAVDDFPVCEAKQNSQKASYNFDLCDTDSINPFKSGGSKLQNSPPNGQTMSVVAVGGSSDDKAMKMEFVIDSGVEKKPPPKKLGKRPNVKVPVKKQEAEKDQFPGKRDKPIKDEVDTVPPSKVSYNFDWDKLDDPNFNPFGGASEICGSSVAASQDVAKCDLDSDLSNVKCKLREVHKDADVTDKCPIIQTNPKDQLGEVHKDAEVTDKCPVIQTNPKDQNENFSEGSKSNPEKLPVTNFGLEDTTYSEETVIGPVLDLSKIQSVSTRQSAAVDGCLDDDMFVPASELEGFDKPIEIDYLEQFGTSSFKESALRKQSLFLKFDPLLRESPKKQSPFRSENKATMYPLLCIIEQRRVSVENKIAEENLQNEEKPKGLDLLGTFPVPCLPNSSEDAIFEVLKYSQRDMDAVVEKLRQEVQETELQSRDWKNKYETLEVECLEMRKIVAEYEGTITQMMEDYLKQKESTTAEIKKLQAEKRQAVAELNALEKSFSDMLKRTEKQKEVIEGYCKNEEALKKCAKDYLARIKKEEQRYQALKAHAEEKLKLANEEIAQVRSKGKAEVAALQASLRKEQMRIQSLEKSLEQKAKENEELTKICDDLILKMEKI
ncbi:transforming acidic coiled-coil-containing protein 3 [Protopterus annectens]|uniref:transforming acidic coiled-coil-containing protein 3 n=1 Tax=Protopterus annectens TaxID=7888 RepID=UPI001CFBBBEF|nr:transforming acidic coiled-coil-containing protein 3 [Protopterus annectens]